MLVTMKIVRNMYIIFIYLHYCFILKRVTFKLYACEHLISRKKNMNETSHILTDFFNALKNQCVA